MAFCPHVEYIKKFYLEFFPDREESEVARKLLLPTIEITQTDLEKMWKSVKNAYNNVYEISDDLWVHSFIEGVYRATSLPPYYYKSKIDRCELIESIQVLTNQLSNILAKNDLDYHLIHLDNKIFNGFYLYEYFGESNQQRMDNQKINKINISDLLLEVSERAKQDISHAHTKAKASANIEAIRFVRSLAQYNKDTFKKPLNAVTSMLVLAIYGINYSESDIVNLLNRPRKTKESKRL